MILRQRFLQFDHVGFFVLHSEPPCSFAITKSAVLLVVSFMLTGCSSKIDSAKANQSNPNHSVHSSTTQDVTSTESAAAIVEDDQPDPNTPSKVTGHQRMVRELARLHNENKNNPYFEGALKHAQQEYQSAKQSRNPYRAIAALYSLGREWTQNGKPEKGLEALEELETVVDYLRKRAPERVPPKLEVDANLARAIAGIRKGENENCVYCLGGEGCLFPIREGGVHRKKEGSQTALKYLDVVLKQDPENLTAIWLLNIAHMTLGTYPDGVPERYRLPEERLNSAVDFPRFQNISTELNIDTFSHAGGVVVEDFDGDLDLDLFVSSWATDGQCRYYRNDGSEGFSDQTEASGLEGIVGGLNTRQIDFDNDGDPDVLILRGAWLQKFGNHPNSLLRNDGGERFVDVAYETGIAGTDFPTQAAAVADYDLDGDLDIFVGNEYQPDQLLRNDNGKFTNVAKQAGVDDPGFAKGCSWGDIDNDGDPDLFVSVMGNNNRLYKNNGDGTFEHIKETIVQKPKESFSSWFFDYNNDGNLDLFVAAYDEGIDQVAADYFGKPMQKSDHDHLFQGNGQGGFVDVSKPMGLGRISQTMGSNFGDLNNDGLLDFYLATGSPALEALQPNLMYLNQGDKFVDVSIAGGFSHLQKGHAISFVDLDHDGDQDVFAELGGAYEGDAFQNALFQNPGFKAGWIKLQLVGTKTSRTSVGARVEVVAEGPNGLKSFHRVVENGSSFGSNPLRLHVGLGTSTAIHEIRVRWPGTTKDEVFQGMEINNAYRFVEGSAKPEQLELPKIGWKLSEETAEEREK